MKLRIRSLESRESSRVEVPNPSNLLQLKQAIMYQISLSSTSSSAMDGNLLLSLNGIDELCGSSPVDSLQSLGVTSGDLIYYSFNPFAFSRNPNLSVTQSNLNNQIRVVMDTQMSEPSNLSASIPESVKDQDSKDALKEGTSKLSYPNDKNLKLVESSEEIEGTAKFSMPNFLKKVFTKEFGDVANDDDHKLVVIAVHAVLLESGFVSYDPMLGMKVDGFHVNDEWPKSAFGLTLQYTLPEIAFSEVVQTVVLRFQTLGKFLNIYGSVAVGKKGFGVHRVCLDLPRFIPALCFILKKRDHCDSRKTFPIGDIFEFWRIVKDELSYPLLIDLCERASLVPPPCFMMLPTEIKLTILEKLPALIVARVCCVSSELCFVASNNELWRAKYIEDFGEAANPQSVSQWKEKFYSAWKYLKNRKRICTPHNLRNPTPVFRNRLPVRMIPAPPPPFRRGGDVDHVQYFAVPLPHVAMNWRAIQDRGGLGR